MTIFPIRHGARVFVTCRSMLDRKCLDEQTTGIRCDHRVDTQVAGAFEQILKESGTIHILVNNVLGGARTHRQHLIVCRSTDCVALHGSPLGDY
jgi:NAD(P)-dependent dehydrogenase (short-subunit alcohol dehydrogenase family)